MSVKYKLLCLIGIICELFFLSGCNLLENAVSNVGGWDISACIDGFGTCWELYSDNQDKFNDSFATAINGL